MKNLKKIGKEIIKGTIFVVISLLMTSMMLGACVDCHEQHLNSYNEQMQQMRDG